MSKKIREIEIHLISRVYFLDFRFRRLRMFENTNFLRENKNVHLYQDIHKVDLPYFFVHKKPIKIIYPGI